MDIADRLIDSVSARFYLLACHPHVGRRRDEDLRLVCGAFPWASTSSSTDPKGRTC
jgi:hypothetical protein